MRKLTSVLVAIFLTWNLSAAQAAPTPSPTKPKPMTLSQAAAKAAKKQSIGPYGCYGQIEDPHYSTHVPGTINVISRTVCRGHQVSVQTSLYLGSGESKFNEIKYQWHSARDDAELSTAFGCTTGHSYVIVAVSFHFDEWGHGAETRNSQIVYCGIHAVKKPLTGKK